MKPLFHCAVGVYVAVTPVPPVLAVVVPVDVVVAAAVARAVVPLAVLVGAAVVGLTAAVPPA
ncbi:putative membrane protein [Mycobacterium kansasii 732]|nr:putative membrane protein [Mycobacterium kansasii 732]